MIFKPKFIYFDLDDTLLNHKQAEREALQDVFNHFDLFSASGINQLIDIYHQVNIKQWGLYSREEVNREQLQRNRFELTLRQLGLDDTRFDEIGSQYMRYYQEHWQWMEGAEAGFKTIADNYPTGILTNGFTETQKKKFKQFDLYNSARHVVISEEVGKLKPHPKIFEHATRLTGYQPGEILYVGDSYTSDVIGGAAFGWKVAWFTKSDEAEKHKKADFVFSDFSDLKILLDV